MRVCQIASLEEVNKGENVKAPLDIKINKIQNSFHEL